MDKFFIFLGKWIKNLSVILVILLIITGIYILMVQEYVIIRFGELGPITKNMSAYYNGFKIGKVVRINPDTDFKHILVRVNLTHSLGLPQNTTVSVERFPTGELYLQFRYPQSPSLNNIRRGDILEGMAPYSLEQFMMGQNVSGISDMVSLSIIRALDAADAANQQMRVFFQVTSKLIKENGKGINSSVNNINAMTKSLAEMSENLNQSSRKLNDALSTSTLKGTTTNVKDASLNIKEATESIKDAAANIKDATGGIKSTTDNFSKATGGFDKTMKKIDETVSNANTTAANLNILTSGLNRTMSKRFGGMRVIFGTPINPQKSSERNACK